jgi:hypothetical protein
MQKPQGYDETEVFTEYKTIPPGGYICRINGAKIEKTQQSQKEVLILAFDIAEGEYKDYYSEQFIRKSANATSEVKWPGTYRQLTEGKSLPFFKGLITAIENSNPGYTWNWDEKTLKGKLFGGVFGQEEYQKQNNGGIGISTKCQQIRSVEQIRKGVEIPQIKRLKQGNNPFGGTVMPEEQIPF